jgi:ribonuclease D
MPDDATWIDTPAGVDEVAAALAEAPWHALDTESNSMFVYRERVCLLQLNAGGRRFVIDTLALPNGPEALKALAAPLQDRAKPTYVHGGEYDVGCLRRDYGIQLAGVWDSQQAASLLGWERTGYGAVVDRICAVALSKAYTQYDWATRPLDPLALQYAIDDVVYLPRVVEELQKVVAEVDIAEEVAIANAVVENSGWSGGFDPSGFWRLKGIRELPNQALPTLAAVWAWRDEVAKLRNIPPGRVVANDALLSLAHHAPTNFGSLKKTGVRSWVLAEHGDQLIELFKRVRETPGPVPPRPNPRDADEAERARENRLKDWRRAEAEKRKVPLQLVLPARALDHLKQHGAGDLASVPQLGEKRARMYGDDLRRVCG